MTWFRLDDARIRWFDLGEHAVDAVVRDVIRLAADTNAPEPLAGTET
jgi:hypothetical protein